MAGGFIEYQDPGVFQNHARQGDALFFAAAQPVAAFTHYGVIAFRKVGDEIVDIGKRIATMSRLFLLREGFTSNDDKLPHRMMEAHDTGPIAGRIVSDHELHKAIVNHYLIMGWNENGVPKPEEISRLALDWVN